MKYLVFVLLATLVLANPLLVAAETRSTGVSELKKEIQQKIKELKGEVKKEKQNLKEVRPLQQEKKNIIAKIVQGEVTAVNGSTLTVVKDGKTYTVNTDSNTKLRRHFWGKSSLSEISVGDKMNIQGKFTDEAKTTILANMIRNTSVLKRSGVFFGTVTSKDASGFVMNTLNKGSQTVVVDSTSKFVNRKEGSMNLSQVNVGDRVRVKGLWDKTLSKITEVRQVKDFTLPVIPKVSPSVTVSPTP